MSSREIAELTGSTHDNVLKTVRKLVSEGVVSGNETPYTHPQNSQTYKEFHLDYRNTMVVVSGYSVELRARIIDRWMDLEMGMAPARLVVDPSDPKVMLAVFDHLQRQVSEKDAIIAQQSEKVSQLDRLATAEGSLCVTDAAKALQVRPSELFRYLRAHHWIYKRAGTSHDVGYQARVNAGDLEHKVTTVLRADGSEKLTEQVRVTPQGLTKLAKLLSTAASAA
ncbi:phage antirepressor KilAC domain-containing protein [Xanthobacteraceae bacterium A53D]